ncbi:hypothetical protein ACA910_003312 [Epithemia clementina (nom. ined.)]
MAPIPKHRPAFAGPAVDGKPPIKKEKRRPPRTTPKRWLSDNRSQGSGDSSAATPTSVTLGAASVLTRELSDLSGSYLNGTTVPRGASTGSEPSAYQSDQSATSYQRPWRLAKILSAREPSHPQPPPDCNDSVGVFKEKLLVGPHGLVEVVPHCDNSVDTGDSSRQRERQPIVILLMDPGRKMYELMQLWIDMVSDSVRDVLHAVQLALSNRWRQDYDGLFQTRNNSFHQLIHILDVSKYDVQPMELWVAKPWAMPAKATISYASKAVQHLQQLQIISQLGPADIDRAKLTPSRKPEESILVLSREAQTRSYVPGGILRHHHAHQFLSFSPPFESTFRVDVLAGDGPDDVASQLSDSQVGTSFASGSNDEAEDPFAAVHVTPHDTSGFNNGGHEVVRMRLAKYPADKTFKSTASTAKSSTISSLDPKPASPEASSTRNTSSLHNSSKSTIPLKGKPPTEPPISSKTPSPQKRTPSTTSSNVRRKPIEKAPAEPKGMTKLVSLLNCRKSCGGSGQAHRSIDPLSAASPLSNMETMKESSANQLWKVWEDGSQVSDSRPLLRPYEKSVPRSRSDRSDWL